MTNLATTNQDINSLIKNTSVQEKFNKVLGNKANGFIASMISMVNSDNKLKECTPQSILSAAMTAATLELPINQNLGFAYIIPYNKGYGKNKISQAQFQMGYKGFVQLAARSGQIRKINAHYLTKSQFISYDPITDTLQYNLNASNPSDTEPYVYIGYLELINGFSKYLVMSKEEITAHALRYSQSYKYYESNNGKGKNKNSTETYDLPKTLWHEDFNEMAKKTVIKLLISKYAPLSIEMQTAVTSDQAVIKDNGETDYIDNPDNTSLPNKEEDSAINPAFLTHGNTPSLEELDKQMAEAHAKYQESKKLQGIKELELPEPK